jgi:hypothetical protein
MANKPAEPATKTVSYYAISVLSSRTMWFNAANFVVAALSLTEVATLIPPRYVPLQSMLVALINLWLRKATVRPVAFIGHGDTQEIKVPKLSPPKPPAITD